MRQALSYVTLALFVEVPLDEHGSHRVAEVAIDVRDAELPPRRGLFATEKEPVQVVLNELEPLVQVVDPVTDEAPQNVIRHSPWKQKIRFHVHLFMIPEKMEQCGKVD